MIKKYTKNGEITFDTELNEYTVWDEVYLEKICVTPYPQVAESALEVYIDKVLEGFSPEEK